MKSLRFLVTALLVLAVGQMVSVLLYLALLLLFGWAVCFRTKEVRSVLGFLLLMSLLVAHPGWFVVLLGLALFNRWLDTQEPPPTPAPKLLAPPTRDQPHP